MPYDSFDGRGIGNLLSVQQNIAGGTNCPAGTTTTILTAAVTLPNKGNWTLVGFANCFVTSLLGTTAALVINGVSLNVGFGIIPAGVQISLSALNVLGGLAPRFSGNITIGINNAGANPC